MKRIEQKLTELYHDLFDAQQTKDWIEASNLQAQISYIETIESKNKKTDKRIYNDNTKKTTGDL